MVPSARAVEMTARYLSRLPIPAASDSVTMRPFSPWRRGRDQRLAASWHNCAVTISIDDLERAATSGWQATEQERLGDWLLRAASGFTGRANSALAAGDPGRPLTEAIEAVCRWYAARGLPPMIAVSYPAGQPGESALDRLLASLGWSIRADA